MLQVHFLSPSVWLFGARMRLSRGPLVSTDQREPWTVKKGDEGSQQDAESIWDVLIEWGNSDFSLFLLPVCEPHWRTPAPGRHRSKRWWRVRRVAAASGSSCRPSSARRTWCSGWPARSWTRRPTRLWLRRKSVKYTRTSSPSSLPRRWGFDEEGSTHFCLTFAETGVNIRGCFGEPLLCVPFLQVSLDSHVRDVINRNMLEPTSHTFEEAQQQIYTLMQRDSYPRFINSATYTDLLKSLEEPCPEP